jgi:FtsZ-interacting cell division protein ZipA
METILVVAGCIAISIGHAWWKRRNDTRLFIKIILADKPKREAELNEALALADRFGDDRSHCRSIHDQQYASQDKLVAFFIDKYGPQNIDCHAVR